MKIFVNLFKTATILAALAACVGVAGMVWVWLTSSRIRTDEYTHLYGLRARGTKDFFSIQFYLSDQQVVAYQTFEAIMNYGAVAILCLAGFVWVLQKISRSV